MTTKLSTRITSSMLIACGLTWLGAGAAIAAPITLPNVPDFSQIEQPAWTNFCTPTSGTNIPYYFAPTYPGLHPDRRHRHRAAPARRPTSVHRRTSPAWLQEFRCSFP